MSRLRFLVKRKLGPSFSKSGMTFLLCDCFFFLLRIMALKSTCFGMHSYTTHFQKSILSFIAFSLSTCIRLKHLFCILSTLSTNLQTISYTKINSSSSLSSVIYCRKIQSFIKSVIICSSYPPTFVNRESPSKIQTAKQYS